MTRCKFLLLLLFCTLFGNAFAQDCPRIYRSGDTLKTDPAGGYQWFFNGNPIPSATSQWFLAKDKGNYTVEVSGTSYPFPVIFGKNELIGRVFDHKYEPVAGAKITLIDQTTVSDAQGNFRFASVSNMLPTAVLTATKESYWKNVQRVTFFKNSPTFVNLMLDTLLVTNKVDAQKGAIVSDRGFTLQIPPNGVVTADGQTYQGMINLSLKRGFPSEENFGYRMPGGDFSAIDANGQEKILISYGFMSAEMHGDNGEELKLAPEAEATLEFYTSFAGNKVNPDSMPLWHFDETHALWFPEGTARKVGPRYVGTVKHFSSWNCDLPQDRATVTGTVVNCKGNPLPGIPVTVGQRKVTCNAGGTYESFVPASTAFDVTANYIDSLHVAPLTEGEIKNLNSVTSSKIVDVAGFLTKDGMLIVLGQGVAQYSVDGGKTYQAKNVTLKTDLTKRPTNGIAQDEDGCVRDFRIFYLQIPDDCQLVDLYDLPWGSQFNRISDALETNLKVLKMDCSDSISTADVEFMTDAFPCMQSFTLNNGFDLGSLPESVGNWTMLQEFKFGLSSQDFSGINTLPESIGNWTNLRAFYFYPGAQIKGLTSPLPESVGNWTMLEDFLLTNNALTTLPESIGNWKKLEWINLDENQLATLPESVGNWTKLRGISLEYNPLTTLPQSVGNWKELIWIVLDNNQLTTLPESIGNWTKLQTLHLFANQLTSLPESIGNLTSVDTLLLSDNKLTTLPATIANLKDNLKLLTLDGNPISEGEKAKIQSWLPNTTIIW